jgi:hypothetical protein
MLYKIRKFLSKFKWLWRLLFGAMVVMMCITPVTHSEESLKKYAA